MTFSKSRIITNEIVISISFRQILLISKHIYNFC